MDLVDFNERKAKKEGVHTPKALFFDLSERVGKEKIEMALVVYKTSDGMVCSNWSDGLSSEYIGLLEIAKQQIFQDMQE